MTYPLTGGVMTESGSIYLLVERYDAEDDESVIFHGVPEGTSVNLLELTDIEEFQKIIPLTGLWQSRFEAAAMTAEGTLFLLEPQGANVEAIPGAGFHNSGAKGIGRMTSLGQVADLLIAAGYGGQVYVRYHNSGWSDISLPPAASPAEPQSVFWDVQRGPGQGALVFAGSDVSPLADSDEIDAANEAGDADLLADLILAASQPNTTSLRIFDGTWSRNLFAEEEALAAIIPLGSAPSASWLIFQTNGAIFQTADFAAFELLFQPAEPIGFSDIKLWKEQPLLLSGNHIFILRNGTLQSFEPALPEDETSCLSISPAGDRIAAFYPDHMQVFDGSGWTRLDPIFPEAD